MNNLQQNKKSVLQTPESKPDPNRFYSILLDARASSVSENIYDTVEKIMKNESNKATVALDYLTVLKKNLEDENIGNTIDLLVRYYQDKLALLQSKEDHIKKISIDSRELLEEKRKRDSEIASVKQEIADRTGEVERLTARLHELRVKEQELTLIETQVRKELQVNANEILNGLYEIVLSAEGNPPSAFSLGNELDKTSDAVPRPEKTALDQAFPFEPQTPAATPAVKEEAAENETIPEDTTITIPAIDLKPKNLPPPFPTSVVKTTDGSVIGEYFYDPKVLKSNRQYILNTNFFKRYLSSVVSLISKSYDEKAHGQAIQMVKDVSKRIAEETIFHFEIATNEILNKNTIKELWQQLIRKEYREIFDFCSRLNAKIETLGNNYIILLQEQMERYSKQ